MIRSPRMWRLHPLAAIPASFLASAAFFVAIAAAIPLRDHAVLIVLWGLICLAVVVVAARRLGPLYGVPLAIAAGLAFDSFYIPPSRSFGSRDWENYLVVAMYIGLGVLVGALAERTRRRGEVSESDRSKLADEQAALRRVATLVARGIGPDPVFRAVAEEVEALLGPDISVLVRFEPDGTAAVKGARGGPSPAGARVELVPDYVVASVRETGHAARFDIDDPVAADTPGVVRALGIHSGLASPIVVDGDLWGAITVASLGRSLPADTERRLAGFTELVASAISNAESRAELTASRARIVAAADDSRRRIERDLHDGVQQRLVSLALGLRAAEETAPSEQAELRAALSQAAEGLNEALSELREISRGIHPAILSHGGLAPALRMLARRSGVPVEVTVGSHERLPEHLEVAAYYVVAEALANVAKHGRAASASVYMERAEGALRLRVRDDGIGGADPARGSGLTGLSDRVQALGGTIAVESPPGSGTSLEVTLPIAVTSD